MQRFGRAIVRPERDFLSGAVDVDEVLLALSRRDAKNPRPPGSKAHHPRSVSFTHITIVEGNIVLSGESAIYATLYGNGVNHNLPVILKSKVPAYKPLPTVQKWLGLS